MLALALTYPYPPPNPTPTPTPAPTPNLRGECADELDVVGVHGGARQRDARGEPPLLHPLGDELLEVDLEQPLVLQVVHAAAVDRT